MKVIRPDQLASILGVSKMTVYRMEKRGDLPPRRKISKRIVGYFESEVHDYLNRKPKAAEMDDE